MPAMHEIDYKIFGDDMQYVEVELDPNEATGSGDMTFHDIGVAVFPSPSLVFKLNYTKVIDHSPAGAMSDKVLGSVGWLW